MQVRSWMAAVVLVAGSTLLLSGVARSQKSGSDQTPPSAEGQDAGAPKTQDSQNPSVQEKKSTPNTQTVELNLLIAGLGQDGCEVEIKPGNRSCRFQPQHLRVESQGKAKFLFRDIELRGADRNCTFAITVHETGQASRTIYRGFRIGSRLTPGPASQGAQSFTCYMNSPSKLAGLERTGQTRR
ncbi:MAG: hypothetical protein WA746_19625 [Isosphaeraceae bacterium]